MIHAKLTQLALPLFTGRPSPGCRLQQEPATTECRAASGEPAGVAHSTRAGHGSIRARNTECYPGCACEHSSTPASPPPQPVTYTIPAGTRVTVRLAQTIASNTAHEGDSFDATVTSPIVVKGKTLVTTGSTASGTVTAANSRGKFKGAAVLSLRLASLRVNGTRTPD